jgi:LysM repeat protein/uncharacterized coiled-coil protein SlyX
MLRQNANRSERSVSRWRWVCRSVVIVGIAVVVAGPLVAEMYKTVVVRKGDTLWGFAQQYLGDGMKYPKFTDINALRSGNPNFIYPGEVFNIPGTEEPVVQEPVEVEIPVDVLTQMLTEMNSRLEDMHTDLKEIRADLGSVGTKVGSLEQTVGDVQAKAPTLDLSAIEDRMTRLDTSVTDLVTRETESVKASQSKTATSLRSLQDEMEMLARSLETQAALQKKALEELNAKVDGSAWDGPEESQEITDRRNKLGLLSVVVAGLAFLTVSATR